MIPRAVQIHPAALEEAEAATDWYAARSRRVAERFLEELTRAIEHACDRPEQFPAFISSTRRIVLHKFPFVVIFREDPNTIEIIAIAHGRRRPGYWRYRV